MCDWPTFSTCCIGVAISGPSVMFVGLLEGVINAYIYITTINYGYWSYVHQLSYQTGAPPSIILHVSISHRSVGGQALQLPVATVTTLNSLGESFSGHHEALGPWRLVICSCLFWMGISTVTICFAGYIHVFYPCFFSNGIISMIKRIQRRLFIPHITDQWLHMDVLKHGHRLWK